MPFVLSILCKTAAVEMSKAKLYTSIVGQAN
jgi:hypothetical protein